MWLSLWTVFVVAFVAWLIRSRSRRASPPPSKSFVPSNDLAVVIGGGIAGLFAAAALSRFFRRVLVLEKDSYKTDAVCRKFVPQGTQFHTLQPFGMWFAEELFPGFVADVIEAGGVLQHRSELLSAYAGKWVPRFPADAPVELGSMMFASRPCWESVLLRRVRAIPNVEIREGVTVTGLVHVEGAITGVEYRAASACDEGGESRQQAADFVVEAAGRSSKLEQQLLSLGYQTPPTLKVTSKVYYANALYETPPNMAELVGAETVTCMDAHRGALLSPVENKRTMFTLLAYGTPIPTDDPAKLNEWLQYLTMTKPFEDALKWNQVRPWVSYAAGENIFKRWDKLSRFPENLFVAGDSVAMFNPIYGQGMMQGAMHAMTLMDVFREQRRQRPTSGSWGVGREAIAKSVKLSTKFWSMSTSQDLLRPQTVGDRSFSVLAGGVLLHEMFQHLIQVDGGLLLLSAIAQNRASFAALLHPKHLFPIAGNTIRRLWRGEAMMKPEERPATHLVPAPAARSSKTTAPAAAD